MSNFTPGAARKIGRAARRVERSPQNISLQGLHRSITPPLRTIIRGKLNAKLEQGGSAVMTVWRAFNGNDQATSETYLVYDWLLKPAASMSQPKPSIAAGKKVMAQWFADSDRWYVTAAECP